MFGGFEDAVRVHIYAHIIMLRYSSPMECWGCDKRSNPPRWFPGVPRFLRPTPSFLRLLFREWIGCAAWTVVERGEGEGSQAKWHEWHKMSFLDGLLPYQPPTLGIEPSAVKTTVNSLQVIFGHASHQVLQRFSCHPWH